MRFSYDISKTPILITLPKAEYFCDWIASVVWYGYFIMEEIWKELPGHNGKYLVSDMGSVKRMFLRTNRYTVLSPKFLKPTKTKNGYFIVWIEDRLIFVHRLVARTFISNPLNRKYVNHLNGIKSDNRVLNLEWTTYSENNAHAYKINLKKPYWTGKKGALHCNFKGAISQYDLNGVKICSYPSPSDAALTLGVRVGYIRRVCSGERGSYKGFIWKRD